MTRFEQLVTSDRRDYWGVPRPTGSVIVNIDDIAAVQDATVDTTYQAFFSPTCPAGVYAGVHLTLRSGLAHTVMLGQFDDVDEADREVDRFTRWLTGHDLLV